MLGDRSYIHYLQATYLEQSAACYLGSIAILQQIQDTPQDSLCDCYGASVFELGGSFYSDRRYSDRHYSDKHYSDKHYSDSSYSNMPLSMTEFYA